MTKEDNEDFHNSVKCWICDNNFLDGDVKVDDDYAVGERFDHLTNY